MEQTSGSLSSSFPKDVNRVLAGNYGTVFRAFLLIMQMALYLRYASGVNKLMEASRPCG